MAAAALPLVDLLYRRGQLHFVDSQANAKYFLWFSFSLVFWAAQGLYARAFYAAGNTLTPMIASSLITVASLPIYSALFRSFSAVGLVIASDVGIAANCTAIAFLLHRRNLVRLNELHWSEIGKAFIVSVIAGLLSWRVAHLIVLSGSRLADLKAMALITVTWAATVAAGLWITKSELPFDLCRR